MPKSKNTKKSRKLGAGFKERRNAAGEVTGLEYRFQINGRRYSIYGRTVTECREKELKKRQELADKKESRKEPTLDEYYATWSAGRENTVSESTQRTQGLHYNACANVVIASTGKRLGDMKLKEIQVRDIREVQAALLDPTQAEFRGTGKTGRTRQRKARSHRGVNDSIAFLSHIFSSAIDERLIDYNPCGPVHSLKTESIARDSIHRALTPEEEKAFFKAAEGSWYYNLLRFLLATGCRIGEAGALTPADIEDGKIHIGRTITRGVNGDYHIGETTKTATSRREIPVNAQILAIIQDEQEKNAALASSDAEMKALTTGQIFKSPCGRILRNEAVDREIQRICDAAGLERFTAHAFRATFATRCNEAGVDPRTVQELLGHADFRITMNLYTHVLDNTKQSAMDKLGALAI